MKKKLTTLILAILSFLGTSAFIVKYQSGIAGWTGSPGEGDCGNCHGGGFSQSSSLRISSVPEFSVNEFVPGTNYTVTVTVAALGYSKFGFDCEILDASAANAGTMLSPGSGVYFLQSGPRKNAVHNAPKAGLDSVNFSFVWKAPLVGDSATIYATGNAVNGTGTTSGDFPLPSVFLQLNAQPQPDTSDVGIREIKEPPVAAVSIYPNPAGDLCSLSYSLDQSLLVSVQLTDVYGKTLKELINETETPGPHTHLLYLQGIPSGIYFVKLSGNGSRIGQKMLVVK